MGVADLTVKKLKGEMGFAAVFIGIGNPEPKKIPIFEKLEESHGFFTSKDFLPKASLNHFSTQLRNMICDH